MLFRSDSLFRQVKQGKRLPDYGRGLWRFDRDGTATYDFRANVSARSAQNKKPPPGGPRRSACSPGRNRFQSPATFDDYRFEIGTDSTETARSACSKRNGNRYAAEPSPTRRGRPSHSRSSRPCERARRDRQKAKRRFPARTRRLGSLARSAGNRVSRPIRRA